MRKQGPSRKQVRIEASKAKENLSSSSFLKENFYNIRVTVPAYIVEFNQVFDTYSLIFTFLMPTSEYLKLGKYFYKMREFHLTILFITF